MIAQLWSYENTEEVFYSVRSLDRTKLSNIEAAARTIFLNRTFQRPVQESITGQFNVPLKRYKELKIIDEMR